jgi:hypothetical protein
MIRFPIDLRVALTEAGFFLTTWKAVNFETPSSGPTDPEILAYSFGHVHGILACGSGVLTIVAIVNDEPGNGEFAKVMGMFESVAENWPCPLRVGAIWNRDLKRHLLKKRGYQPDAHGEYSDSVIKLPQRLTV